MEINDLRDIASRFQSISHCNFSKNRRVSASHVQHYTRLDGNASAKIQVFFIPSHFPSVFVLALGVEWGHRAARPGEARRCKIRASETYWWLSGKTLATTPGFNRSKLKNQEKATYENKTDQGLQNSPLWRLGGRRHGLGHADGRFRRPSANSPGQFFPGFAGDCQAGSGAHG
jgi:hypothetical protein